MAELTRRALRWHGTSRRQLKETDEPNKAFLLLRNGGSIIIENKEQDIITCHNFAEEIQMLQPFMGNPESATPLVVLISRDLLRDLIGGK